MSWALSSLDSLVEKVDYGLTASAIDADGPRFLRITDLQDNTVDWSRVPSCTCSASEVEQYRLEHGDIVFARTGATTGKSYRLIDPPKDAVFASYLIRVRPKPGISSRYLGYFFQSPSYWHQITKMANGAAQPGVNSSKLKELLIPVPPTEVEQKRIAAILDKADAIRRKRQQAIELADRFLRSVFLDFFGDPITNPKGWRIEKLGELGTLDRGKSKHRPRNDPSLLGGEHPLIQTGDVANSNGYIDQYNSTYSDLGLQQSRKWSRGTLCITIAANIANTGVLAFDACFPDSVVGYAPNEKVTVEYIQGWLDFLQKTLEANAPKAAQKNINLAILKELDVPVPDKDLQDRYTEIVLKLRDHIRRQNLTKSTADDLFDSISRKAFSGELQKMGEQ